jgi:hypothetical protein
MGSSDSLTCGMGSKYRIGSRCIPGCRVGIEGSLPDVFHPEHPARRPFPAGIYRHTGPCITVPLLLEERQDMFGTVGGPEGKRLFVRLENLVVDRFGKGPAEYEGYVPADIGQQHGWFEGFFCFGRHTKDKKKE